MTCKMVISIVVVKIYQRHFRVTLFDYARSDEMMIHYYQLCAV